MANSTIRMDEDLSSFIARAKEFHGSDASDEDLRKVWDSHGCDADLALGQIIENKLRRKTKSSSTSSTASLGSTASSTSGLQASENESASEQPAAEASRLPTESMNIQVVARFRPLSERELEINPDAECVEIGDDGTSCTVRMEQTKSDEHLLVPFQFNRVFHPISAQEDVYECVATPIVESVIQGYNGAILAYGQTGSGKTHTMMGPMGAKSLIEGSFDDPELGIIPRAMLDLQTHVRRSEGAITLRVAYIEIYQEKVFDLLTGTKCKKKENTDVNQDEGGLYLPNITEMPVTCAKEAMEIMQTGNKARSKAATKMNRDSSRSHAIFVVTIVNSIDMANRKVSQLYLVDLAGSERVDKTGVWGTQLKEAQNINRSLLTLGIVIEKLSANSLHVPYRDSKLTRLLQNALGGNARTCLVCTASPHADNAGESVSTLRFGDRASKVKNVAKVNIALDAKQLKALLDSARAEIAQLKSENELLREGRQTIAARSTSSTPQGYPKIHESPNVCPVQHSEQPKPESDPSVYSGQGKWIHIESAAAILQRHELVEVNEAASPQHMLELISRRLFTRELLPSLICPLTQAVMRDPVCATDGSTYDRSAVERLMRNAGRLPAVSPMTGKSFPSKQLVPNLVIKQLIDKHRLTLPPLERVVSPFAKISIYVLEYLFTFLPGRSLGRAQIICPDFLAVGSSASLWTRLLQRDFRDADAGQDPRQKYAEIFTAEEDSTIRASIKPKSMGLHLAKA